MSRIHLFFSALAVFLLFSTLPAPGQIPKPDNPAKSISLTQKADAAAREKNWDEAKNLYLEAIEMNSKNGPAWGGLGRVTYELGDARKAKEFLKEGWACGDLPSLRSMAAIALLNANSDDMEELLPDLMKQKDKDPQIRAMLVLYGNKSGKDNAYFSDVMLGLIPSSVATASDENLDLFIGAYNKLGRDQEAQALQDIKKSKAAPATSGQN